MKSKISRLSLLAGSLFALPLVTMAQSLEDNTTVGGSFFKLIEFVAEILGRIFPLITIVLVIAFAVQIFLFMKSKEDLEKAEPAKKRLMNAFIALFVWFVLFGLISLLAKTFGLRTDGTLTTQTIPKIDLSR